MLKLLPANASTLISLSLTDMFLNPQGSWEKIFKMVRQRLSLTHAYFDGKLCNSVRPGLDHDDYGWNQCAAMEDEWNFDWYSDDEGDEGGVALGRKLASYLIDGTSNPLNRESKTATQRGHDSVATN